MIKQYRYQEERAGSFKSTIYLYHDGTLVETKSLYLDELDEYIDKIAREGYTFGYTSEEVNFAYRQYIRRKNHEIKVPSKNPCDGCIHWHEGECSYYLDDNEYETEEEKFLMNCAGCCCGDGCECNKGSRCDNYDDEEEEE